MSQSEKSGFLRSDSKSWVSSNLFFLCLNRLSISDTVYYLESGTVLENYALARYVETLYDELMAVDLNTPSEKEAHEYSRKVSAVLKSWAKNGHSLKVV